MLILLINNYFIFFNAKKLKLINSLNFKAIIIEYLSNNINKAKLKINNTSKRD